jgi:hypothetical protein
VNEAERKKYDEAEANGSLPRLRLAVKSFCAPIWWEISGNTILGNGSMCASVDRAKPAIGRRFKTGHFQ